MGRDRRHGQPRPQAVRNPARLRGRATVTAVVVARVVAGLPVAGGGGDDPRGVDLPDPLVERVGDPHRPGPVDVDADVELVVLAGSDPDLARGPPRSDPGATGAAQRGPAGRRRGPAASSTPRTSGSTSSTSRPSGQPRIWGRPRATAASGGTPFAHCARRCPGARSPPPPPRGRRRRPRRHQRRRKLQNNPYYE